MEHFLKNVESKMEELEVLEPQDTTTGKRKVTVDVMIATHADTDHFNGIRYFTKRDKFQYDNYVVCSLETFDNLVNYKNDLRNENGDEEKQMFGEIGLLTVDNFATQLKLPECIKDKVKIVHPDDSPLLLLRNKVEYENGNFERICFGTSLTVNQQKDEVRRIICKRYNLSDTVEGFRAVEKTEWNKNNNKSNVSLITLIGNISVGRNLLVFTGDNQLIELATILKRELQRDELNREEHDQKRRAFAIREQGNVQELNYEFEKKHIGLDNSSVQLTQKIVQRCKDELKKEGELSLILLQVSHHGSSVIEEREYDADQYRRNNGTAPVFYELLHFYLRFPAKNYLISAANFQARRKSSGTPSGVPEVNFNLDYDFGHPHPSTVISILESIKEQEQLGGGSVKIYSTNEAALPGAQNAKLDEILKYCGVANGNDAQNVQEDLVEFFYLTGPRHNKIFHKHRGMFKGEGDDATWHHRLPGANLDVDGKIVVEIDRWE